MNDEHNKDSIVSNDNYNDDDNYDNNKDNNHNTNNVWNKICAHVKICKKAYINKDSALIRATRCYLNNKSAFDIDLEKTLLMILQLQH